MTKRLLCTFFALAIILPAAHARATCAAPQAASEMTEDVEREARAEASELRRGYVALMNFWNQRDLLGGAAFDFADLECGLAGGKRPCGRGRHFKLAREAVPGEASRIADGDPLFGALLNSFFDDGAGGDEPPTRRAARPN